MQEKPETRLNRAGRVGSKHLAFNHVGGLIVEDGPQAVGVRWCLRVQGEGQGHVNGGKFIPEFLLILQEKQKKKTRGTSSTNAAQLLSFYLFYFQRSEDRP